jgi:hypothetical protein
LKGSDPSASSGIQQHEQNESVFSQIQNDKWSDSQHKEYESSVLYFDQ